MRSRRPCARSSISSDRNTRSLSSIDGLGRDVIRPLIRHEVVDDTTLTLAASGWTYRDTFVLFDHQTESLWYPMQDDEGVTRFMGIAGQHAGRMLDALPFSRVLWLEWVEDHPGSSVLL